MTIYGDGLGEMVVGEDVRLLTERLEEEILSPYAMKSSRAQRQNSEDPCPFRTAFQRDRDRIIHSKAFRRLKHKTQVYISPGDHYRTRMTHSLEVSQICRTIARGLRLNEDLTEAIALGHDVGHTPFGHVGEEALAEVIGQFNHNEQSLRVVDVLERDGRGLNLTNEVRDGILCHTGPAEPGTLEGSIVRIGDRIAYLCHDYDDSLRAGLLRPGDLPETVARTLGTSTSAMITAMVADMIIQSRGQREIRQSPAVKAAMEAFRDFMFSRVYFSPSLLVDREKAKGLVIKLYEYFIANPNTLPKEFCIRAEKWGWEITTADYIAGLTDMYAIHLFESLFIPSTWGWERRSTPVLL